MRYAKGIMWLDDTRIPFVDEPDPSAKRYETPKKHWVGFVDDNTENKLNTQYKEQQGRFTPNLLVCDDMLNDGIIYKSGDGSGNMELININDAHHFSYENPNRKITKMKGVQYNDKGTNSRYYDLDKWFDKVIDGL